LKGQPDIQVCNLNKFCTPVKYDIKDSIKSNCFSAISYRVS
jgi:hypothetical protein